MADKDNKKSNQKAVEEKAKKIKKEQENKNNKDAEKNKEEWLEEEINNLDNSQNDELMKKAADQIEKLQAEVKE